MENEENIIKEIFKDPDCENARLQVNRFIEHINKFIENDPIPHVNVIRVLEHFKKHYRK